ncbi:MAG: hypothetical protein AAB848_01375 [Patescibacteria group bacterium]
MNEHLSQQACLNKNCSDYGKNDFATIAVHDKKRNRLRCKTCGKTWSSHHKEFHFGLRTNSIKVSRAIDMLKAKLPVRKIARLIEVNAGTVMRWKKKLNQQ